MGAYAMSWSLRCCLVAGTADGLQCIQSQTISGGAHWKNKGQQTICNKGIYD